MQHVNPSETFPGTIVLVAPHMDDEVLACGGTLAQLPEKERIHIIYATDGMRSPAPILAWRDAITPDLGAIRRQEARTAAGLLGLPLENLHFCNLPEAELRRHREALSDHLMSLLGSLNPDTILLPFRYDRHPDHLAVNHVLTRAWRAGLIRSHLIEYFVYYRWRLLPERDVRRYIRPELIMAVDLAPVAALKRAALECFATQTTRFYDWQTRPILTPLLLDDVCRQPELFLRYDPAATGADVFTRSAAWIRLVHRLEPSLQRWRYRLVATGRRLTGLHER